MGAIFTAGGIVVAMVSLYSLTSVARTAREAVRDAVQQEESNVDARVQQHVRAYDLFAEAKHNRRLQQFAAGAALAFGDATTRTVSRLNQHSLVDDAHLWLGEDAWGSLDEAETFIKAALESGPVSGARLWMGVEHYHTVSREFIRYHEASPGTTFSPVPSTSRLHHAVHWLEDAKVHEEAGPPDVHLLLADLYGMMGDWPATVSELQTGLRRLGAWQPPRPDWSLVCLVNACGSDEARLRELAGLLGKEFPWPRDRVLALFDEHEEPKGQWRRVWAVNQPAVVYGPLDLPRSPGLIVLHPRGPGLASAMWDPAVQPGPIVKRSGIPPMAQDGTEHQEAASADVVVDQLCSRFFVIERAL
jgi:hypothetical protein